MIIVAGLTYLIQDPSTIRYFLLGKIVGLAAVFGRHHGVYGAVASIGAMTWLMLVPTQRTTAKRGIPAWTMGVIIGYLPVVGMCLLIPGYLESFINTIIFMLEQGNTNLPLRVPWPWTVGFGTAGVITETRWFLIGLCFIALVIFSAVATIWVVRRRIGCRDVQPAFVAAICAALPYAHFAFARADLGHLAQGIYPMLVGLLVIGASLTNWISRLAYGTCIAVVSMFILAAWLPGVLARTQGWARVEVSGSSLRMDPSTAEAVTLLRDLTERYATGGRAVLVSPFWPGAYPLLDRPAPLWEIYALSPRSEQFQKEEIERIKTANPDFVFVINVAMDGGEELRFANSHRLIEEYIRINF